MKLLWLCNIAPGVVKSHITGKDVGAVNWVDHVLDGLRQQGYMIRLLCPGTGVEGCLDENCSYATFPAGKPWAYSGNTEVLFHRQICEFEPDVIHCWGTEYAHSLAMVNAAEAEGLRDKCVISIQGLVSVYAHHFCEGLPGRLIKSFTFRDLLRWDNLSEQVKVFSRRGVHEVQALSRCRHIIGRTDWDRSCSAWISPEAEYHFCNETLRKPFYYGAWDYGNCQKHRIFVSSCSYPVKGFHYLLEAFAQILEAYPDTIIAVPGNDFVRLDSFKKRLREDSYHRYLRKMIQKHKMEDKILFLGKLSPEEMKEQYLLANVFALPSTIENSPNSLGEAMLLGTPCVAADVGGVSTMMSHGTEGYIYQSTAPYMLAHYIMKVFSMEEKVAAVGTAAAKHARATHDPEKNLEDLITIYQTIAK